MLFLIFFFNATATPEIYTLSLHDALPICWTKSVKNQFRHGLVQPMRAGIPASQSSKAERGELGWPESLLALDRKSTRLNSSHQIISYAVFCLKKKKKKIKYNYNRYTDLIK